MSREQDCASEGSLKGQGRVASLKLHPAVCERKSATEEVDKGTQAAVAVRIVAEKKGKSA